MDYTIVAVLVGLGVLLLVRSKTRKRRVDAPVVGESKITIVPLHEAKVVRTTPAKKMAALDAAGRMLH
jgi:hypothetical protein